MTSRRTHIIWLFALFISVLMHAVLAMFFGLSVVPRPIPKIEQQSAGIRMETTEIRTDTAAEQALEAEQATETDAAGTTTGQHAVRTERATASPPPTQVLGSVSNFSERATTLSSEGTSVVSAVSQAVDPTISLQVKSSTVQAADLKSSSLVPTSVNALAVVVKLVKTDVMKAVLAQPQQSSSIQPRTAVLQVNKSPKVSVSSLNLPSATVAQTQPVADVLVSTARPQQILASVEPGAHQINPVEAASLGAQTATPVTPDAPQATATQMPATRAKTAELPSVRSFAALGWTGAASDKFDAVSLSAVQSFMRPLDAESQSGFARERIGDALSDIPCSRLQATFQPETGKLELRGHIPDAKYQAPILEAMRKQMGSSIPVTANLMILPEPQCDILSQIQVLGLPQSADQIRDPLAVGADTQVYTFEYALGDRVIVHMSSPEYPAYVYVDFFDVDDRVLHLRPNQSEAVELHPPNTPLAIGADRPGTSSVQLYVQPPFGQELVVAYASSVPLYEGLRETIEPADLYLEFMRTRIAEIRAADPNHKGEWVYMFVLTHK